MSISNNKKSVILMSISFFVIAFLGIIAGNWFSGWRSAQANSKSIGKFRPMEQPLINVGDTFPDVSLLDYTGSLFSLSDLITNKKTIIMFLEPGCKPCKDAIINWSNFINELPDDVQIIGIASSLPKSSFPYIDELNFPYPFYCDTAHKLVIEYGVNGYPGAMGINEKGVVSFGYRHIHNEFSPLDAYKLLNSN